ncbi:MAG TPA: LytTR family DNA-binding domain-containing protein [Chitinophagaceae bacterium]|nr:LytTR family DNA-binding domain-containing protein [Chitinophagaceae bacterium]
MRILIVEDEMLLAKRLQKLLLALEPNAEIAGITQSVEETVHWLQQNPAPDLVMMDIELADGQSFDIFKQTQLSAPVIFTTAYDEYAIKAFKVNSIDYLLKPIKEDDLKIAINKFRKSGYGQQTQSMISLLEKIEELTRPAGFRNRFLIKQGQKMMSIDISEVAYIFSENKFTFIRTHKNQKYIIDATLDILEKELSPKEFFRANRQYILANRSVVAIHTWFNQKLKVEVLPPTEEHVIISRDKANAFKTWMGE